MKISEHIATEVLEELMDMGIRIPKKIYLDCECMAATRIEKSIKTWLRYDIDFKEVQEDEDAN